MSSFWALSLGNELGQVFLGAGVGQTWGINCQEVPITKKALPVKVLEEWLSLLWEDRKQIPKAARFIQAILAGGSARLSEVGWKLGGREESNYKALHRFLSHSQPARALLRLYREEAGNG